MRFADEAVHIGPPRRGAQLPAHPEHHRRRAEDRRRRDPPRLRLPLRGPVLRRDLRRRRDHLHRPAAGRDGEGRRQGDRARPDAEGRPAAPARARSSPVNDGRRGARHRRRDRLSGDHQGGRGRRRARHERRLRRRRTCADLYQTTRATAQAVFKDSAVYIERYLQDAAPHRDPDRLRHARQRRLPRRARLLGPAAAPEADRGGAVDPPDRRDAARRSARRPSAARSRSATRAPGRWSSCSTTRATSPSWR